MMGVSAGISCIVDCCISHATEAAIPWSSVTGDCSGSCKATSCR